MSGNNGKKRRSKRGRPTKGNGVSKKRLKAEAIKADGQAPLMAENLGIAQSTAYAHLQKPEIQNAIQKERDRALAKANLTRERAFQKVSDGMNAGTIVTSYRGSAKETKAPDYKERREHTKIALQLIGELNQKDDQGGGGGITVIMPTVVINGSEKQYEFEPATDV